VVEDEVVEEDEDASSTDEKVTEKVDAPKTSDKNKTNTGVSKDGNVVDHTRTGLKTFFAVSKGTKPQPSSTVSKATEKQKKTADSGLQPRVAADRTHQRAVYHRSDEENDEKGYLRSVSPPCHRVRVGPSLPAEPKDMAVIEISSDSDTPSSRLPLLVAQAKARKNTSLFSQTSSKVTTPPRKPKKDVQALDDIIDLT